MRLTASFALIVLLAGLAAAQEPKPPPIPVPAPPDQTGVPTPYPAPKTAPSPAINSYQRVARIAAQRADEAAAAEKAAQDLARATSVDQLLDEATEATDLDRDTLRPAIEALRAQVRCERCGNTGFLKFAGSQGEIIRTPCPACRDRKQDPEADKRFAEALEKLPAEKRAFFAGWAAAKRKRVQDLTLFGGADLMTKESLRTLLAGQRQLELARREIEAAGPQLEAQQRALADAATTLSTQRAKVADEMSALARLRIESALDKPLIERYRDLATTVDSAKAKVLLEEQLRKLEASQATHGDIEKQIQDLQAQRHAIDSAIERATTALVRERAERLHTEAKARDEAAQSDPLTARPPVSLVTPPEPAQPTPRLRRPSVTATTPEPAGAAGEEIRLLRDELRKLRAEVEALRQKSDREPK